MWSPACCRGLGDLTELAVVLSPVITERVEWSGAAERWFEVTEISELTLR